MLCRRATCLAWLCLVAGTLLVAPRAPAAAQYSPAADRAYDAATPSPRGAVLVTRLDSMQARLNSIQAAQAYPAPRSVTDLKARARSSRRIELTFSAPVAAPPSGLPAKRYVIKQARSSITAANFARARSLCGGICTFSATRVRNRIRLTVEDLIPNRRFHYALRPLDSAGRPGATSNVSSARTQKDRRRPGRPIRLSARPLQGRRVRLRFRAPGSDGRTGPPVRRYLIKQSKRPITSARRFRRARTLCRSTCRFAPARRGARLTLVVSGLCPRRRYHYAIRARDEGGNLSRIARFRAIRAKGRSGLTCL